MKRTIISAITLIAIITTTGCTPRYTWTKPGITYAEGQQDFRQCNYESQAHGNYAIQDNSTGGAILSGLESGWQIQKLMKLCMEAKGYTLVKKDAQQNPNEDLSYSQRMMARRENRQQQAQPRWEEKREIPKNYVEAR